MKLPVSQMGNWIKLVNEKVKRINREIEKSSRKFKH